MTINEFYPTQWKCCLPENTTVVAVQQGPGERGEMLPKHLGLQRGFGMFARS